MPTDVNVIRDFWDFVGLGAGIVGALAAAWAIWYATRAKQDIVDERRRQFELDVLREIATGIDNGFLYRISDDPERLRVFARRLDLLPGKDLPFWREMLTMHWPDDVGRYFGYSEKQAARSVEIAELAKARPAKDASESERIAWQERYDQVRQDLSSAAHAHREEVSRKLLDELVGAITVRVEAGAVRSRRRLFRRG